jgi:hypothetical protein
MSDIVAQILMLGLRAAPVPPAQPLEGDDMKISFNKKLDSARSINLAQGRHVGTVIQVAAIGDQPGFNVGDPAVPSVGVVVQLDGTQVAKKMRVSDSPLSAIYGFLHAALPDFENYAGDNPVPLTLGCPVAVEVTVKGQYANIASFHRPESFEISSAPKVMPADLVALEDPGALVGESGKALFMTLHRDIRSWISQRVRG